MTATPVPASGSPLAQSVDRVLAELEFEAPAELAEVAAAARHRLGQPLQVAVAGRVNAGKSTLINALAGGHIAATDATECTRIVTWYQYGPAAAAVAVMANGQRRAVDHDLQGTGGFDLGNLPLTSIDRIEVSLPLELLRPITLVDTPGIASLTEHLSRRALDLVTSEKPSERPDVVLYLMRYAHEQDSEFLRAYGGLHPGQADPLRAIGVLSRADEIGSGRLDSMQLARAVVARTQAGLAPMIASLHPVSGLLALGARTVTDDELGALGTLATMPPGLLDRLVRSASCFTRQDPAIPVPPAGREALLRRIGLFGVRHCLSLVAAGVLPATDLRTRLWNDSGAAPVRGVLIDQFAARAVVLRAAAALRTAQGLVDQLDAVVRARLDLELDRARSNSHDLTELNQLRALRLANDLDLAVADIRLVARCLGGHGTAMHQRLGVPAGTEPDELRPAAVEAKRRLASLGHAGGEARNAIAAANRSMDRLLAEIDGWYR